jgi:hypothetical protein
MVEHGNILAQLRRLGRRKAGLRMQKIQGQHSAWLHLPMVS